MCFSLSKILNLSFELSPVNMTRYFLKLIVVVQVDVANAKNLD